MVLNTCMDNRFSIHNTHIQGASFFKKTDPQLRRLESNVYVYHPLLIGLLPTESPGVYTLTGGRQIGKTTLLKQWMLTLIEKKILAKNICFISGELIDDQHALVHIAQEIISNTKGLNFLIIDEVTYIKDWDKGIKFLYDSGSLDQCIMMLSGSDSSVITDSRMRFPGRRGSENTVDFHYDPLSFFDFVQLVSKKKTEISDSILLNLFQQYLIHGGFLTAINDYAKSKKISTSTFRTYSDWIRGDMLKKGKQDAYLRPLVKGIIKRYGSQITWNSLAKELPIDHPKTISDYVEFLEKMDVTTTQEALLEDSLSGAPKKARKIYFKDPFIYHSLSHWLDADYTVSESLLDSEICSTIVESVVVAHFKKKYPTFYIKAEGEVDIAYIKNNKFFPVEIKWGKTINSKDLKQIKKYKNGQIWSQQISSENFLFLPRALYNLN